MSAASLLRDNLGATGAVQVLRDSLGATTGGGDPPAPPASDDYSYPITEYLSKRPPVARVRE